MSRLVSITLGRPFAIHEDDIDMSVGLGRSIDLDLGSLKLIDPVIHARYVR